MNTKNGTYYKMHYIARNTWDSVPKHFGLMSYDQQEGIIGDMLTLRRLANKHHKLAEMDCNGEGSIRGQHYYNGTIDDYAKRTYGYGVKSAYITDGDTTVFDIESEKVHDKIESICKRLGLRVEFQGDPRGYTVKFYKDNRFLDIQG